MKSVKLTSLFAMMTLAASVAVAQPPAPPADGKPPRGERRGGMRPGGEGREAGPYAKLFAASKLESLNADQKAKVDALLAEKKAGADELRKEMREAMEKARESTDRESRRAAMEPLRKKHEQAQKEVDTALADILTADQVKELDSKADQMRQAGRERFGRRGGPRPDDANTTDGKKAKDPARKGKKGEGKGKGNKGHKKDGATSGTATVNPFSE